MAVNLKSLITGKSALPPRIVIYGEHGLGKSTFGSQAPSPVFITTEDGLGDIDATSFPMAKTYQDVLDAIGVIYSEEHEYKTVVLDSLDWLEDLIWKHVAEVGGHESIEGFGYGKGYTLAADSMREVLSGLSALREHRGMAVILTAHSQIKRFDDPTAESYDRYLLKLHAKASGIVQEWADVVGFCAQAMVVHSEDVGFNKSKSRGVSMGENVLHLQRQPAFDAKCRYSMPAKINFRWAAFAEAFGEATK